jgi:sugar-specific transcriptional regulator TrmB
MQTHPALHALEDFGLSEKEARTYLASLALGSAVVADVALKAELTRPTAYLMVDSLKGRGLITEFKKGKKTFVRACEPAKLSEMLAFEKEQLTAREKMTGDVIEAIGKIKEDDEDIDVRLLDGDEADQMLRQACLRTPEPVRAIANAKNVGGLWAAAMPGADLLAMAPKLEVRAIFQSDPMASLPDSIKARLALPGREIAAAIIIVESEIFCDYLTDRTKKLYIRNEAIAQTLRTMFDAIYDESKTSH